MIEFVNTFYIHQRFICLYHWNGSDAVPNNMMMRIFVPDVGDGLAAGIWTLPCEAIQIDCGSQKLPGQKKSLAALKKIRPYHFFLSHFHSDHYSGLFLASSRDTDIRQIFFPRLPIFGQKKDFLRCLLAMTSRLLGDRTGSREVDFLNEIRRINSSKFTYRQLSAGETVEIAGSHFEILWPPRKLEDGHTLKVISDAISDFERATNEDEELRKVYDVLKETKSMEPYLTESETEREVHPCKADSLNRDTLQSERKIPECVAKANESLRKAANHLSLAFRVDNRLLFLGDLESSELKKVAAELKSRHQANFFAMITPHHGTHWHGELKNLKSTYAISSQGKVLCRHFREEFKKLAVSCLNTYTNGDIYVPQHIECELFWRWRLRDKGNGATWVDSPD